MNPIKMSTHRFGIITAVIYASLLVYLPPFQKIPDLFREEFIAGYIRAFGYISIGILSGVLLYYRPQMGRLIALILASIAILMRVAAFFPNVKDRLYALYILTLQQRPLMVTHNDIIFPLFLIFSVVYLGRNNKSEE